MAHILHIRTLVLMGMGSGLPGCLLGPPVEVEPPEENRPPYIAPGGISPPSEIVSATGEDPIRLSVDTLLDPNPEASLYYVWYSPARSAILDNARSDRVEQVQPQFEELFSQYEPVSISVNPCDTALRGRQSETVWFYVTDRPWERVSILGVVPESGAFVASWVWVIDLSLVACT